MAEKKVPPEFFSEAQYDSHMEGLTRELAGATARLEQLEGMPEVNPADVDKAKAYVENVNEQIQHYSPKKASRPKEAKETR